MGIRRKKQKKTSVGLFLTIFLPHQEHGNALRRATAAVRHLLHVGHVPDSRDASLADARGADAAEVHQRANDLCQHQRCEQQTNRQNDCNGRLGHRQACFRFAPSCPTRQGFTAERAYPNDARKGARTWCASRLDVLPDGSPC